MLRVVVFLLLQMPLLLFAYDIKQIRTDYHRSIEDEKKAEKFYLQLKGMERSDPLLLAYFGSTQAVRAKHAFNPYTKMSYLRSGVKTLNEAVSKSPSNLEIRFLRFTLEHYIPSFLAMSKHLEEDRKQIVFLISKGNVGLVDAELLKNMISFMKESGRCTKDELLTLNKAPVNG